MLEKTKIGALEVIHKIVESIAVKAHLQGQDLDLDLENDIEDHIEGIEVIIIDITPEGIIVLHHLPQVLVVI